MTGRSAVHTVATERPALDGRPYTGSDVGHPSTLRSLVVALLVLLLVAAGASACGGSAPGGEVLVTYERTWPDGYVDRETIWVDGRIEMHHGDHLERFRLADVDMDRLMAALAQPIPTGTPADSPVRVLTLADGSVVTAPRPEAGSITELLDRLMETHAT
jgi:hypothetical protein